MLLIPNNNKDEIHIVTNVIDLHADEEERRRHVYACLMPETDEASISHLNLQTTLLMRPTQERPGIHVYHIPKSMSSSSPNRRATCLAMTCGLFHIRFYGPIMVDVFAAPGSSSLLGDTKRDSLVMALCHVAEAGALQSPDDRQWKSNVVAVTDNPDESDTFERMRAWILDAARHNYHDQEAVQRWAQLTVSRPSQQDENDGSDDETHEDQDEVTNESSLATTTTTTTTAKGTRNGNKPEEDQTEGTREFVTQEPLCLHCRRHTRDICAGCQGAYFCGPPRECRSLGWSHGCLCSTWKVYVDRREELSFFSLKSDWYRPLMSRPCQVSSVPYEDDFLTRQLGVSTTSKEDNTWWTTERHGWSGGSSASAAQVHPERRVSFRVGFAPLTVHQIPAERLVTAHEWQLWASQRATFPLKNDAGLYRLESWSDYYELRQLPPSSPAALLLTFPLTLYHALVEFGSVPWTVSHMLEKPLRIDVVGAEKELHFLDLFQELAFLLGNQVADETTKVYQGPLLELVFVVRQDMLPASLVGCRLDGRYGMDLELSPWIRVRIVEGTYGDAVNPNLDCGSRIGPPDMLMAFNAGLFAYESWRSVLTYLRDHPGVVGVMTDYNEWSGLQCASLGGNRETLRVNPFRQPRAMPVFSMNLPQFSNGFLYAINPQELE